jgi:hypothetical protein
VQTSDAANDDEEGGGDTRKAESRDADADRGSNDRT